MATVWKKTDANMDDSYRVKIVKCGKIVVLLPALSMTLCIIISFLLHWEESTATHCKVPNYLPSISAAIGEFTPQRYIWRIGIALHCSPRFLAALVYLFFYEQVGKELWTIQIAYLGFLLNVLENFSLLGLSFVSSTENFEFHESAFISFIVCSMGYMVISCFLLRVLSDENNSQQLKGSFRLKVKIMGFYMLMFALAVYFYFRHNRYCEPGVYSLFALCEYMVVLANIAFHAMFIYDFGDGYLAIGPLLPALGSSTEKYRYN